MERSIPTAISWCRQCSVLLDTSPTILVSNSWDRLLSTKRKRFRQKEIDRDTKRQSENISLWGARERTVGWPLVYGHSQRERMKRKERKGEPERDIPGSRCDARVRCWRDCWTWLVRDTSLQSAYCNIY